MSFVSPGQKQESGLERRAKVSPVIEIAPATAEGTRLGQIRLRQKSAPLRSGNDVFPAQGPSMIVSIFGVVPGDGVHSDILQSDISDWHR